LDLFDLPHHRGRQSPVSNGRRRTASRNRLESAAGPVQPEEATNEGPAKTGLGEEIMHYIAIAIATLLVGTMSAQAQAPSWSPPAENQRCPSKWGAADERGAANHQKPAAVLNAAKLIKTGEVIELGHASATRCRSSARAASTCTSSARS
jgi:hypothetical protein